MYVYIYIYMYIFECNWDDIYPFKLWTSFWDCLYHSYKQSPVFPSCSCKRLREWLCLGGRSFVLVSSQEHSDIWFNKGAQAQASSTCGAAVNACLSDYWSLFIRLLTCKLLSSECASYSRSLCNPTQALTWYPDTINSQQALPKLIEWIL